MKIKGQTTKGVLPMPKFSVYAASTGSNTRGEVIIKLKFGEQMKLPNFHRNLPFEVIVTNQPAAKSIKHNSRAFC